MSHQTDPFCRAPRAETVFLPQVKCVLEMVSGILGAGQTSRVPGAKHRATDMLVAHRWGEGVEGDIDSVISNELRHN